MFEEKEREEQRKEKKHSFAFLLLLFSKGVGLGWLEGSGMNWGRRSVIRKYCMKMFFNKRRNIYCYKSRSFCLIMPFTSGIWNNGGLERRSMQLLRLQLTPDFVTLHSYVQRATCHLSRGVQKDISNLDR